MATKDRPNARAADETVRARRLRRGVYVSGFGPNTIYRRPSPLPPSAIEQNEKVDERNARKRMRKLFRDMGSK